MLVKCTQMIFLFLLVCIVKYTHGTLNGVKKTAMAVPPTTLETTLPHATSMFPNIRELLRILCTLPVTSCSAERSFSGLKRIKTAMRSTMIVSRLLLFFTCIGMFLLRYLICAATSEKIGAWKYPVRLIPEFRNFSCLELFSQFAQ